MQRDRSAGLALIAALGIPSPPGFIILPDAAPHFDRDAVPDSLETHAPDATPRDPECQSIVAATRAIESDDPGAMES